MNRRTFIARITFGFLAAPLATEAQSAPKPARVALVCGARCECGGYDAFRQGLRELGRVEGRNLVVDVRGAERSVGNFSTLRRRAPHPWAPSP